MKSPFLPMVAFLILLILVVTPVAHAVGSWTPVARQAPNYIGTMLLLTDGTVMAQGADNGGVSSRWYRLTPDASGSYANGTWTQLASMHQTRLYYASAVMINGQVLVAGGEYSDAGSDTNTAEIYNPLTNNWTVISSPSGWNTIGDAPITSLADGRLLLGSIGSGQTALYNSVSGLWTNAANKIHDYSSTEESWALLPSGSVLTVDCTYQPDFAEQYAPASNLWLDAGQTPSGHHVVENSSEEIGPALLLPNKNVLFIGATGHTALYSTITGAWLPAGGPDFPTVLDVDSRDSGAGTSNTYNAQVTAQAKDAPGCLMVNGKVLTVVGPTGYNNDTNSGNGGYPAGQYFFEYDPGTGSGTLTAAPFPDGSISLAPPFVARLLDLPNGQVLYSNFSSQLYIYTPDSGPDSSWQPVITGITANPDGSYQVQGTQFNGLSQASAYGDDASSATNYPLVRLTDSAGKVTYARTYNHSTMGVATGTASVSTNFLVPSTLAAGAYHLQVVANGIASQPYSFSYPFPPAAPMGLNAVPGVGQITLNWAASSRAASYNVYRGTNAGGEGAAPIQTGVTATKYTDNGLTSGVTYYYKVTAVNSGGESGVSNEASAKPLAQPATVANSSFEMPSVGSASFQYNPPGGSWTFSGYSGIQSNGSLWYAAPAPDGTQTAFLQGYPGPAGAGSLSQSVNFTAPGNYALTFQAARRQGQVQPLKLSVDGVQVGGLLTAAGNSFAPLTSATFTITTAGNHTITLAATDSSADLSAFVDQISTVTSTLPIIANGSFEMPSVGSASFQYNPPGGSWTFSGYSGIQSNGSLWYAAPAPDGTQTAFLQGYPGPAGAGSLSQSVNFTAPGNYALTFQAARRQGQVQPLKLSVDGVQVGGLLTAAGNSFAPLTSATFTITTAGAHTITLAATDSSADLSALLDQFALSQK